MTQGCSLLPNPSGVKRVRSFRSLVHVVARSRAAAVPARALLKLLLQLRCLAPKLK